MACLAAGIGALASPPAAAQELRGAVLELRIDGVVDPFVANYVRGGIERAADEGANAVLITIDTPGGLSSSMREITQAILNSRVPVIGYVSPEGARAASAGTFILLSCNVAAMAPGTNVGAAHPVGISGAIESEKATNDAAASIRAIAEERGRNEEWAVSAVRDSVSASASEALDLDVIDLIAPGVGSLLADVDGQVVTVGGGEQVTLDVAGVPVRERDMGLFLRFLHGLLDPNLAFIFFWGGLAFIVLELFTPGGVLGTAGGLMLVSSLVALGMLPFQLIGVVLLIASVVFFVLELKHPGVGVPAVGGVVCLVLGGWYLFDASVPGVRVSPLVIVPVAAFAAFFFLVVVRSAIRLRHRGVVSRSERLVGVLGTVVRDLGPVGVVKVASEEWTAEAVRGTPKRGDRVRVVAMDGLTLKVEPAEEPAPQATVPAEGRQT
jgi:membrane-bound serine protease (ClpP class)